MLRLRSDEQLVALLRSGHDEAFQIIHDRYRARLFAYVRQMLPLRQDAEDALQEVFERAYASLRAGDRDLALRPWLYRIAHNRCIDHLRRPAPPPPEAMLQLGSPPRDPVSEADCREALRRLIADVHRLPEQQRSALLMRELGGISYADVAQALGVTVPAVKSLLVRARVSLAAAGEARDAACDEIRAELVMAHEGRVRPNSMARRHLRDCAGCREFRGHLRGVRRSLLALAPLGPFGVLTRLLGGGTGSAAGGGAAGGGAAGGGAAAACTGAGASGLAGTSGLLASAGAVVSGAGHVATLLAATVVTAGGAAAISHASPPAAHRSPPHSARPARPGSRLGVPVAPTARLSTPATATAVLTPPAAGASVAPTHAAAGVIRRRHTPSTAAAADNSLGPIPDPTGHPVQAIPDPSSPGATGTATPPQGTPGTQSPNPTTGTPTPTGATAGGGTGTPTPVTPTPAGGGGGGTPTPTGATPSPGTPTPATGGTGTPTPTSSGTPSTPSTPGATT